MFALHDQRFRDILLLALGFFGLLWFFIDMKNHHPLTSVESLMDESKALATADSIYFDWEYKPENLKKRAVVNANEDLINQIQAEYGRQKYLSNTDTENYQALPLYTWAIQEFRVSGDNVETAVEFDISKDGELVAFQVSDEVIARQTPVNRKLIRLAFPKIILGNAQREDSVIAQLIDFQHIRTSPMNIYEMLLIDEEENQNNFVWKGAELYLKNSYWKRFNFKKDSLSFDDDGTVRYARLFFTSLDTVMGVVPKVEIEMLPAGSIREMSYTLEHDLPELEGWNTTRSNIILGMLLVFAVWLLTSFYLRIKARAIDTRPALIVAIISGFLFPLLFLLELAKTLEVSLEVEQISNLFNQFLSFGIIGAVTAVSFFIGTAVSDSITRQFWPDQLKTWDLVRRGMFKNKPVGWAIIRALCIGSFLIGLLTLLFLAFPDAYIDGDINFVQNRFVFSPIANIIITMLYSLGTVVLVYMIIGNQLYSITNKKWLVPLAGAILFALVEPIMFEFNPSSYSMAFNLVVGFMMGMFYIYFDFVTVFLGYFIFTNYLTTIQGWLVDNSPDAPIFIGFVLTLIGLGVVAVYFLVTGEEKDNLPDYIPDYIEDQAKEQRVLQELDIARNVQVAFLPEQTPEIPGFDTSAICIPAQETGGDYYDIICLDDEKVAIAIGDVSGKGIQAAFYMTFAKGVIHSLCSIFPSPKMMMFRVNKLFNQNATRGTFISMIYGVLDVKERSFTYIRAGHNPMLYKKADGTILWMQPKGVALGMAKGEIFNKVSVEDKIDLAKGDVLVLYTDGITEAQNESGEFYDEKRLKKLLKREKTNTSKELRDLIIKDVRTFIGDERQFDDMTLVVIKA
ncbi:MAG: PP2C family protein-serine/threonine phosphatase [Balneolaceae bacterium]|nr:PP2C family protein-serine/threonine phosphatase [Balneolaceae bacterium]